MESIISDQDLRTALSHVLWIGGAPDSGKTSIAKALSERYGLHRYSLDDHAEDHWFDHLSKIPTAFGHIWMKMSLDEKWLDSSPEIQAKNTMRVAQEDLPFALDDLLTAPKEPMIVVEGNLYPDHIESLLLTPQQMIWLVPSEAFKLASFYRRGKHEGKQVSDQERANQNHLARDNLVTQSVKKQALARGLKILEVDSSLTLDQVVEIVARHFELGTGSRGVGKPR